MWGRGQGAGIKKKIEAVNFSSEKACPFADKATSKSRQNIFR